MDIDSISFMFKGLLFGLLVCMMMGQAGIRIARLSKLMDIPGSTPHKQHTKPTPLAGGVTLILSLTVVVLLSGLWKEKQILPVLGGALVIFAFGVWDDKKNISPTLKLLGQVLASLLVIASGIFIQIFETPGFIFSRPDANIFVWPDRALTVFWIVGITNAFNLVDSMDGLAVGLSNYAFAFFMLAAYDSQQLGLSFLFAILLGIGIGLLYYNAPPAKVFLGDSGAQTIGFIIAVLAILYTPLDKDQSSSWFVPIMLVGVPIFDTCLVTFSRLRRRLPFYKAGRDHTYHRLVRMGWDSNRAVMIIHFAALALDCLAFIAVSLEPFYANIAFIFCLIMGVAALLFLDRATLIP